MKNHERRYFTVDIDAAAGEARGLQFSAMISSKRFDRDDGEFGVSLDVCAILQANGLFAEWINPGIVGVFDA